MDNIVSAFSVDHVARITGLSLRQLAYWDASGFFKPTYAQFDAGSKPLRVYSFRDVIGLRVIAVLRKEHKISVQYLRKVAEELSKYGDAPWSTLRLVVCQGEVSIHDPATDRAKGIFSGQYVLVPMIDQIRHVERAAAALSKRSAQQIGVVEKRRGVAHNSKVFGGTRVPVRAVERYLDAGYSTAAILKEYPTLQAADIEAVRSTRRAAA